MSDFKKSCRFRLGEKSPAICEWQTSRIGKVVTTSNLWCGICPDSVRVYGSDNEVFFKRCFHRRFDSEFLSKIVKRYSMPTKIIVPDCWDNVTKSLSDIIKSKWLVDIGLTGSIIADSIDGHKDIDIVIWIKDLYSYAKWKANNEMPFSICGIKADYFVWTEPGVPFFAAIFPNRKEVWKSKYFETYLTVPDGYALKGQKTETITIPIAKK